MSIQIKHLLKTFNMNSHLKTNALICVLLLLPQVANTAPSPEKKADITKLSLSYYYDNRDFNTTTIQIFTNRLGNDFSIWGFTDLHAMQDNKDERYNMQRSFSEYRLSYSGLARHTNINGLGLQLEYNDFTPGDGNLLRLGLTYKQFFFKKSRSKPLWLQYRFLPFESDGDGGQFSLIYFIPISHSISISGFADYNIREDQSNEWVFEPQLNILLHKNTYLALEYRYNGFEENITTLDGSGIAIGVQANF